MTERMKPKDDITAERFLINVEESYSNVDKFLEHVKNIWEEMDRVDKLSLIATSQLTVLSDENVGKIANDLASKSNITGDDTVEQIYCEVRNYLEDLRGIENN